GFVRCDCSGHTSIATASAILLTARNFDDEWQSAGKASRLRPGEKVCITQMGWSTYLAFELANFPKRRISPHYFGNNIQSFELTVGQAMPDPELLPSS